MYQKYNKGDFYRLVYFTRAPFTSPLQKDNSSWGVICDSMDDGTVVAYSNSSKDRFIQIPKDSITIIPSIQSSYVTGTSIPSSRVGRASPSLDSTPFLHLNDPDVFDYNSTRNESPIFPTSTIVPKKLIVNKINIANPVCRPL